MLCYAMLCYAVLWYAMLCYAMEAESARIHPAAEGGGGDDEEKRAALGVEALHLGWLEQQLEAQLAKRLRAVYATRAPEHHGTMAPWHTVRPCRGTSRRMASSWAPPVIWRPPERLPSRGRYGCCGQDKWRPDGHTVLAPPQP